MLRASHISKRFGHLEVLKDISLEIPSGKITAVVGPSGAGKSTLLQILGTLSAPEVGGSVSYDGEDVSRMGDAALSRFRNENIGFVFQAHRLLPEFMIEENVALPALIAGRTRKDAMAEARRLLEKLGLGGRLSHRPSELSGGECQRAAVARALINGPKVVLADEPTGSLDSRNRDELQALFSELRDTLGATFVIVTHDATLASGADRTVHMADGRIVRIDDNCK
ncbi:MAG: ABC transporter ATP-binding protein [Muribaculaceae bacterium]|nr:ABC transporter ATP-binding protein [Muribaculaceae bacterium]